MNNDSRIRGCLNPICINQFKKVKFKADELFCSKCGNETVIVCSKCRNPFESCGVNDKLCQDCITLKEDRKQQLHSLLYKSKVTLASILTSIGVIAKIGPKATKLATNKFPKGKGVKVLNKVVDTIVDINKMVK